MRKTMMQRCAALAAVLLVLVTLCAPGAWAAFYTESVTQKTAADAVLDLVEQREGADARAFMAYFFYDSDYAAFYQKDFPYLNSGGYVTEITDKKTTYTISGAAGCMAYANYVARRVFDKTTFPRLYITQEADAMTAELAKTMLTAYAQAGEQIRVDNKHSLVFVTCTENGFYFMEYTGDETAKICLRYTTFAKFAQECKDLDRIVWIYNANTEVVPPSDPSGLSWNGTADAEGKGAKLTGRVSVPTDATISKTAVTVWPASEKPGKAQAVSVTTSPGLVAWECLIPEDVPVTLSHGVLYHVRFSLTVNGTAYHSPNYSFTAGGSHVFGSWVTVKAPTCTKAGKQTRTCICGAEETKTVPKLGHAYSKKWTVDQKATLKQPGSKSHHCDRCGAVTDVTEIPRKPIPVVGGVAGSAAGTEALTFRWNKVNGADGYRVYNRTTGEKFTASGTSLTLTGLKAGRRYCISVRAFVKIDGKTQYGEWSKALGLRTQPKRVSGVMLTAGKRQIKVVFGAATGAAGYEVYNKTLDSLIRTDGACTLTGLVSRKAYTVYVRAYVQNGTDLVKGAWSKPVTVTVK